MTSRSPHIPWISPMKCGKWSVVQERKVENCFLSSLDFFAVIYLPWKWTQAFQIPFLRASVVLREQVSGMQASHLPKDGKLKEGVGKENVSFSVMSDCNPMDCNPPGSSVHGILQARILKWAAISFSRGSSQPRDWTSRSSIGRQILYCWTTRETPELVIVWALHLLLPPDICGWPEGTVFLTVPQVRRHSLRSRDLSKVLRPPGTPRLTGTQTSQTPHVIFASMLPCLYWFSLLDIFLGRNRRLVKFCVTLQFKENLFMGLVITTYPQTQGLTVFERSASPVQFMRCFVHYSVP